jgi:hypothetical protein
MLVAEKRHRGRCWYCCSQRGLIPLLGCAGGGSGTTIRDGCRRIRRIPAAARLLFVMVAALTGMVHRTLSGLWIPPPPDAAASTAAKTSGRVLPPAKKRTPATSTSITATATRDSSSSNNFKKYPCGGWIPNGNLGNPEFDLDTVRPVEEGWGLCDEEDDPATESATASSRLSVGLAYLPDSSQLHCHPDLQAGNRALPILALDMQFGRDAQPRTEAAPTAAGASASSSSGQQQQPEYSLIMPSHCAASTIEQTLPTICQYTVGLWEVIFILDSSWDTSLQTIRTVLLSAACTGNPGLLRARVLLQTSSIYETSSDNLGLLLAKPSHFYVEVQADMFLTKLGWNRDLARPLFEHSDIFSVSGRCAHGASGGPYIGRCGVDVGAEDVTLAEETRDSAIVYQTSNRGPVVWRADALRALKFFDEVNFILGDDDHDLNRRANFRGWHTAYKYAHMYAPLDLSPGRSAALKAGMPDEMKAQESEYSRFRLSRKKASCDPDAPSGHSPLAPSAPITRPLTPLPAIFDWNSPLPNLPPLPIQSAVNLRAR